MGINETCYRMAHFRAGSVSLFLGIENAQLSAVQLQRLNGVEDNL